MRRYRRRFALGFLCSVATTAISLTAPLILQWAIDDVALGVTNRKLMVYGSWLLAGGMVGGLFRFWTRRIVIGVSRDIEYDLREAALCTIGRDDRLDGRNLVRIPEAGIHLAD